MAALLGDLSMGCQLASKAAVAGHSKEIWMKLNMCVLNELSQIMSMKIFSFVSHVPLKYDILLKCATYVLHHSSTINYIKQHVLLR